MSSSRRKREVQHEGFVKDAEQVHRARKQQWHGKKAKLIGGRMVMFEQKKNVPSAFYDKRWIKEDGVHTELIEYHI